MNNFKKASRINLTFQWGEARFNLSDLWQMPLQPTADANRYPAPNLDEIAISVAESIEALGARGSFVKTADAKKSARLATEELRLEILKEIIADRLEYIESCKNERENAERIKQLTAALAAKKSDAVGNMTEAELNAEINKLRAVKDEEEPK